MCVNLLGLGYPIIQCGGLWGLGHSIQCMGCVWGFVGFRSWHTMYGMCVGVNWGLGPNIMYACVFFVLSGCVCVWVCGW